LDALLRYDVEIPKKTRKSIIKMIAYNEYQADKYYKELVEFYITKGQKANPDNFMVVNLFQDAKHEFSYQNLRL
jgi:hypothetical protein